MEEALTVTMEVCPPRCHPERSRAVREADCLAQSKDLSSASTFSRTRRESSRLTSQTCRRAHRENSLIRHAGDWLGRDRSTPHGIRFANFMLRSKQKFALASG